MLAITSQKLLKILILQKVVSFFYFFIFYFLFFCHCRDIPLGNFMFISKLCRLRCSDCFLWTAFKNVQTCMLNKNHIVNLPDIKWQCVIFQPASQVLLGAFQKFLHPYLLHGFWIFCHLIGFLWSTV